MSKFNNVDIDLANRRINYLYCTVSECNHEKFIKCTYPDYMRFRWNVIKSDFTL